MLVRTFVIGFLEMLRRVQWNFCEFIFTIKQQLRLRSWSDRLENEHLGNMDQYRVTREVPLPYAFDRGHDGDDDGDDSEQLSEPQTPTGDKS